MNIYSENNTIDPITPEELHSVQSYLKDLAPEFAARMAPVYELLGFEWGSDDEACVPDALDIEEELYDLIDDLDGSPLLERGEAYIYISTGGLTVGVEKFSDGSIYRHLGFDIQEDGE